MKSYERTFNVRDDHFLHDSVSDSEDIQIDEGVDPPTLTEIIDKMTKEKVDYTAKRLDYVIYALDILIRKMVNVHPEVRIDPAVFAVLGLMTKASKYRIDRYGDEARAREQYLHLKSQIRELENDYPVLQDLK